MLPGDLDDDGISGTLERPALQQLLANISAGKIGIVVVYEVDPFTRSPLDFTKPVEIMNKVKVSLVSVTKSFDATNSTGRLTLDTLLSLVQFERDGMLISAEGAVVPQLVSDLRPLCAPNSAKESEAAIL
ncbi:recombinase family protein [Aurantiacibacter zhengii]|uniref:recombinase family protein n=1 Tax=Aurantiacibacter zhengii TaxID=2307003 RepID=UPI001F33B43E|nr:recombinase family protein [Aurantiacibacter zhengii]